MWAQQILRVSALVVALASLPVLVGASDDTYDSYECEVDATTGTCVVAEEGGDAGAAPAASLGDIVKQIFGDGNGDEKQGQEVSGDESSSDQENPPAFEALEGRDEVSSQKNRSASIIKLLQWGYKEEEKVAADEDVDTEKNVAEPEIEAWERIFIEGAKAQARQQGQMGLQEKIETVSFFFEKVRKQFDKAFDGLDLGRFDLLQLFYVLQWEESVKSPMWKRKRHRFLDRVSLDQALALSDALYFNAVAYADTCEEIDGYIREFRDRSWLMLNCTTESTPTKPAHFLAVRRKPEQANKNGFSMPWEKEESTLEVAFVVRATKDIMDILTDALLESVPYRGGLAHDGILQSAKWLHEEYKDFLMDLLKASQQDKLKLWTVGYSLGAGTAALLTMEFNEDDNENIVSHSLGFGTPALVTRDLSESTKAAITTVINDADCVARMSGPALFNAFLRGSNYNYTRDVLQDLDQLVPFLRENLPLGDSILSEETVTKVRSDLANSLGKKFAKKTILDLSTELQRVELIPPGECIHIYREPGGYAGYFVPCHRFDEIEIVRRMVDDHLLDTDTGYSVALLSYIRQLRDDWNWQYEYDLMTLPHIQKAHAARK